MPRRNACDRAMPSAPTSRARRPLPGAQVVAPMADYRLTVREWPASERPREKLQQLGPTSLSNAELLAILLRVGSVGEDVVSLSQRMLVQYGGLAGLYKAVFSTLQGERGM